MDISSEFDKTAGLSKIFIGTGGISALLLIGSALFYVIFKPHPLFSAVESCFDEMVVTSIFILTYLFKETLSRLIARPIINLLWLVGLSGIILVALSRLLSYYHLALLNKPKDNNYLIELLIEICSFLSFTYAIFCVFNILLIIKNNRLNKIYLITLDYYYFSLGLIALLIKYLADKTSQQVSFNVAAFILGAVSIALRVTKTNGERLLEKAKR